MTESAKDKNKIVFPIKTCTRLSEKELKVTLLNALLRNFSMFTDGKICESLKVVEFKLLSSMTEIPCPIVQNKVEKFLNDLTCLTKFFHNYKIKWQHEPKKLNRKVRMQLHKIYRFAPVFNYVRARRNL